MIREGIVYLVGAGPGDPELITVRGLRRIREADVVVYDRLINTDILDEAPYGAEKIYAGKHAGGESTDQEYINALLVDRARAGMTVVRLKGGDPFVFGRGGEEAHACALSGIRCEVVPGISSAVGVPTNAGIPVTHRGVSASFAVVSAQRADDLKSKLEKLAAAETLVIMMGVARLSDVALTLIRNNRAPQTPVAVIERGTEPEERVVTGTLATISDIAQREGIESPATIIVGEVVDMRVSNGSETLKTLVGDLAG
jgi:uroporphyrin-III C-methyltransferase